MEQDETFIAFCEQSVRVFEAACARYSPETFKQQLYHAYFDIRGRTTAERRTQDALEWMEEAQRIVQFFEKV
jgi:hypothetical protein